MEENGMLKRSRQMLVEADIGNVNYDNTVNQEKQESDQ